MNKIRADRDIYLVTWVNLELFRNAHYKIFESLVLTCFSLAAVCVETRILFLGTVTIRGLTGLAG